MGGAVRQRPGEKRYMIIGAQLIIGHARGGIGVIKIHLGGIGTQNSVGGVCVALNALAATGKKIFYIDRLTVLIIDGICFSAPKQLGIRSLIIPFIGTLFSIPKGWAWLGVQNIINIQTISASFNVFSVNILLVNRDKPLEV